MKARSDIYPVYFLYGPEDYLIEEEIQKLLNQTLSQKERGLNFHLFSGEEHGSQEILQTAYESIKAGGVGLSIGRNVFQHENPTLIVKALSAIVHKGVSAEQALKMLGESP